MEQKEFQINVYCWGLGKEGQLGNNQFENHNLPQKVQIKLQKSDKIIQVQAGGQFSALLTQNGDVYMFGSNKKGKMGLQNTETDYPLPQQVKDLKSIQKLSLGDWHSLALDYSGQCFSSGYNKFGALGVEQILQSNQFIPVKFQQNSKLIQVFAGRNISLFINEDHEIFSAGISYLTGNNKQQSLPMLIKNLKNNKISSASAGFSSCAAITENGQIYTWGNGTDFNLGHGNKKDFFEPKLIEKVQIKKDIIQSNQIIFTDVSCSRGDKNVHMGAVTKNGDIYTWGSGYKGKLGHGKGEDNQNDGFLDQKIPKKLHNFDQTAKKFIAGGIHSAILTQNDELFTFGCGSDGRLGHPEKGNHRYLYKEDFPKKIDYFKDLKVIDAFSSYYHMICLIQE